MTARWWLGMVASLLTAGALASACSNESSFGAPGATSAASGSGAGSQGGGATGQGGAVVSSSSSSNGGAGGGGGGGGMTAVDAECSEASDCKLIDNCCDCMGLPLADKRPACSEVCIQDKCSEKQIPLVQAACEVGRCVLDVSCNASQVFCTVPQPACPPGETAAVVGACWGGCIPVTECSDVSGCDVCKAAGAVCVVESQQTGPVHHCVELPKACDVADCACMGASVCLDPYDACDDVAAGELDCSCTDC
jgi:hypothetical protein